MAVAAVDRLRTRRARLNLFIAFASTMMADPTMALMIVVIALVAAGYHGLIGRFSNGGGGPEGLAAAFGEGWAFLPLGAPLVDFTLTIAVGCAAGASALIALVARGRPGGVARIAA